MLQTSNDPRIQERLVQLKFVMYFVQMAFIHLSLLTFSEIVARRNEFLGELFRMTRGGRDAVSSLIPNDVDEHGLQTFLQRFDFVKWVQS